jgi:hypothetical protein
VIIVVVEPAAFVAVTVCVVVGHKMPGVPEMTPVDVLSERPEGRAGEIDQEATAPPETVGVLAPMVVNSE